MTINGSQFRCLIISASNCLENRKNELNALNVFPVPDGDTGSNMGMTMSGARRELPRVNGNVSESAALMAEVFLRSARGNSGVILSLFFRGMAKEFKGKDTVTCVDLAHAFTRGTQSAYKAVMNPKEGTILTVMRMSAEKAEQLTAKKPAISLVDFLTGVKAQAEETLAQTPEMLPVLKQANVVDAGGCGFVAVLDGMLASALGEPVELVETEATVRSAAADFEMFSQEDITFPYCTECIVTKNEQYVGEGTAEEFHRFAMEVGDSVVFVDDEKIIKLHVHTDDPGKVLSQAIRYGSLFTVKIENMLEQHTALTEAGERATESSTPKAPEHRAPEKKFGFVSVASGEGLCAVFRDLGVDNLVIGGQTMNPSTENIVTAVDATPAEVVFVLPNNSNICLVAEQAAKLIKDKQVIVLPTVSVPEGVSAMLAFDPEASVEENKEAMTEMYKGVTTLSVTFAAHDSTFDGKDIKENQLLGLVNGKVKFVDNTREESLKNLAEQIKGSTYVTLFYGEGVKSREAEAAAELLRGVLGEDAEVQIVYGGQPVYFYLISAE